MGHLFLRDSYVYLIRSTLDSSRTYVGLTDDLKKRLQSHNEGANKHTSKFRPWKLECYIAFETRERAAEFENISNMVLGMHLLSDICGLHNPRSPK